MSVMCQVCGHSHSNTVCPNCGGFRLPVIPQAGWICPKCGGGNAPSVLRCPCVPIPLSTSNVTSPVFLEVSRG